MDNGEYAYEINRAGEKNLDRNHKHCVQNECDFWHEIKRKQEQGFDKSHLCN